jgi:hypothetical protein
VDKIEPEREMIRRALPFAPPVVLVAFVAGALLGGWDTGLSAAIGVVIVLANFVVHGWSLARAARISLTVLYGAALGGVIVRMGVIVGALFALDQLRFFSSLAFVLSALPATALLLIFEMKQLGGRMQSEVWNFSSREAARL